MLKRLPQAAASGSFSLAMMARTPQSAWDRRSRRLEPPRLTIPGTQLFDRQLIGILY
jgi:hypothetical protein